MARIMKGFRQNIQVGFARIRAALNHHLRDRKIVIISDHNIVSIPLSSRFQRATLTIVTAFCAWMLYSTGQYFTYERVLSQKEREIWQTSVANDNLQYQVSDLHKNLSELNGYFDKIREFDQLAQKDLAEEEVVANVAKAPNVAPATPTDQARQMLFDIRDKVLERISSLESIIGMTGLKIGDVSENNERLDSAYHDVYGEPEEGANSQGGPYVPADLESMMFDRKRFEKEVSYLLNLENTIHQFPMSVPMKRYWLSSRFGYRKDPFHGSPALHQGLDFVGSEKSEVLSTAPGIVVRAGRYGAYGKFVEIDHGNGITTRYGHLNTLMVKKGDRVDRGQRIALQGNTGRSTGAHLHYEVRYHGKALDPENFLKAGKYVFQGE